VKKIFIEKCLQFARVVIEKLWAKDILTDGELFQGQQLIIEARKLFIIKVKVIKPKQKGRE
jgi:hypothetical protein